MTIRTALVAVALLLLTPMGVVAQGRPSPLDNLRDLARAREVCRSYVASAQQTVRTAQRMGCGFTGPRWDVNPQSHMSWCVRSTDDAIRREREERQEALRLCQTCSSYVQQAVRQNQANLQGRCGGVGERWHSDATLHRRWCVGVGLPRAQRELVERTRFLDQCRGGRARG
jgi:phage shock protein PspC (stress-responsive transcriptional regulator)